ncbi:MAG TPA: class I SAM-dependent methyltransferase [Bacillus bacterium]|nr:class I SAM-dependent methyltransferase [Bacillus sp. (in: firmicutes)]
MKTYSYLDFLAYMGIGSAHPGGFHITEKILKNENIKPQHHVLDVGCGTGITSAYLARQWNCQVSAIDIHPEMIKKAQRRFIFEGLPIQLVQGNAEHLPFKKETFDYVITESVTAFTTIPLSLQEYSRVLKKDGVLIMLEMTALADLTDYEKNEIEELYDISEILDKNEWTIKLTQAGFDNVTIIHTGSPLQQEQPETFGENSGNFVPIIEPSEQIEPSIYETWSKHELLLRKYAEKLGYSVFRAIRK